MIKNIIKFIAVFALVFAFTSCDEESNFKDSDTILTPVYTISDITGPNAAFKINIYKQVGVIVEYTSAVNLESYVSTGYSDSSTTDNYMVETTATKEREVNVGGVETKESYTVKYTINAVKETGVGTMDVMATYKDGSTMLTSYNVIVSEDEVYN